MKASVWKWNRRMAAGTAIGAVMYGLTSWIGIPIVPDTDLRPAIALLAIFGAIFGPFSGLIAGFTGHVINDLIFASEVSWGWALASGITGACMGLVYFVRDFDPEAGRIRKGHMLILLIFGVIGIFGALAFTGWFDIYVMKFPDEIAMTQVISAGIANVFVFIVLGLPAVWAYGNRHKSAAF
ncbi:UPF0397 protein [Paenibacillus faecis]|uniref:ECF-type riboflavin transporter substrate-binding protein n=1 Tax=Paenibacillus faecis TaxID=862114 RepID=UPI001B18FE1C|nr:ECF-type riboflavin transporter substrate-binding protein [Paenibacillus faecis]GIO86491.1 UPF0397 protein [Paenibacillus faecis]